MKAEARLIQWFFKQLLFQFDVDLEGGTRSPSAFLKIYAPSAPKVTSSSERPIHLGDRDRALESKARKLLRAIGANELARKIRVEWNPRLKTCAGRADYREKLISLNPLLLDLADDGLQLKSPRRQLECLKHSSLTTKPPFRDSVHKLECNMHSRSILIAGKLECLKHSSLVSAVHGVTNEVEPRGVINNEVDRTLRHELAHLLAQFRVGRRRISPHGKEWREACRDLGIADEARCHNLPFATKGYAVRFVYHCPNCRREFPRVRRIRRAIACLACCRSHNHGQFDPRFRLRLMSKI
jgi:predicted SprT family Zn-dependent metalloprotease